MAVVDVLIVGAGPTGLALALWLSRLKIAVRIIDSNVGSGETSRAVGVHARTLEFYRQLDLADAMIQNGVPAEAIHVRVGEEDFASIDFHRIGEGISPFPYMLCYPQDEHERLLTATLAASGIRVEWNTALISLSQGDSAVNVVLESNGVQATVEVPYLVGCDGGRSRVRHELEIPFTGSSNSHQFYVADVALNGIPSTDIYINLEATHFALVFPVRVGGSKRIIGIVPDDVQERGEFTFKAIQPYVESLFGVQITQVHWFSTYRVSHRIADRFAQGRCFLAGDAGHIHSPVGAQGMNTGIGDAVNLAWKLAHVIRGRAPSSVLDSYEPERRAFAHSLVSTTDRAFQMFTRSDPVSGLIRARLAPRLAAVVSRSAIVKRTAFKAVSQVRIEYRHSPMSAGAAGDVHGGDRLPWVHTPDYDNFDSLRSLDWQLHIYGKPDLKLTSAADSLGLPVQTFAHDDQASHAGIQRNSAYLVRPDGYVGLALADQDTGMFLNYVADHGLRFRS